MSGDQPESRPAEPDAASPTRRIQVIGAAVIVALGAGWFVLSHLGMRTPTGDAVGEALGVMLALLVVASIVGAVLSARGRPG